MERVLGLDVHAASCTLVVISQAGKRLTDFPIETNGHALVEAIRRIPGRKHLVGHADSRATDHYVLLADRDTIEIFRDREK